MPNGRLFLGFRNQWEQTNCGFKHFLSLFLSVCLSVCLSLFLSFTNTHTHSLSLTHTYTHKHSHSFLVFFSLLSSLLNKHMYNYVVLLSIEINKCLSEWFETNNFWLRIKDQLFYFISAVQFLSKALLSCT